jgi:cell division protease FtsH
MLNNNMLKTLLLWLFIGIIIVTVINSFGPRQRSAEPYSYSQFLTEVKQGGVKSVVIDQRLITATAKDNKTFTTYLPMSDPSLLSTLTSKGVMVTGKPPQQESLLLRILISWFPMLLLIGVWIFFLRQMQGGSKGGPMAFGRSRARMQSQDQVKTTFADVAGIEEAKEEVVELVEFLKDPLKFQKLGGKIPCGALLVGPPGTGKTLLAKAVAGEAQVPFFSISGSDFVEMFVGVGASRVRDMFQEAKKRAPCIIFIDEIDAVGRHRGAGLGGGHDEREQTLNQLLVEMDGFEGNESVIVIAATNRPDVLDPALLRPGRFDRQVVVPLPDIKGREQILKVHMKKLALGGDIEPALIARGTPGFSGADLANLTNEAALFAAKANKKHIDMLDFEKAKDKLLMGTERRSMVMDEKEKKLTAYHEAGHAIVGLLMPEHDPVYKVSIIPRGRALGVTTFLPEQDRYSYNKQYLTSLITGLYGGRVAEELTFGSQKVTTGASNDIERATKLARKMVTNWGLSDKLGPQTYAEDEGEVFLGHSVTRHKEVSEETTQLIDQEIRRILDSCYSKARGILTEKEKVLHMFAETLVKYETIDETQIKLLMKGQEPEPPAAWQDLQSPEKFQQSQAKEKAKEKLKDKVVKKEIKKEKKEKKEENEDSNSED